MNDTARVAREDYEPTDGTPPPPSPPFLPYPTFYLLTLVAADIVRARIRTMGVEEHRFLMESGTLCPSPFLQAGRNCADRVGLGVADAGSEYYIFDVGGSRGMVSLFPSLPTPLVAEANACAAPPVDTLLRERYVPPRLSLVCGARGAKMKCHV